MFTEDVLDKLKGKTVISAEPSWASDHLYEITFTFTDGTSVVINKEHSMEQSLQAKFIK